MTNKTITLSCCTCGKLTACGKMICEACCYEPLPVAPDGEVHTDCRSEEGITVGLVDTVINCARLLKSMPTTSAVEQALQDLRADADVAALVAEPVPPAGWEVEILAAVDKHGTLLRGSKPLRSVELVDRAHVTRLQAEVERLRRDREILYKLNGEQWEELNSLQSELTKARECIGHVLGLLRADKPSHAQYAILQYQDFPKDQAAPADKGEPCRHEWTDDGEFLLVCTACGAQEDYTRALQRAFELGGTEDGSYHLEADELCEVIRIHAEQPAPVAAMLAEARDWLGDGKHADGLAREHWTPEYAALIDRIDATLNK